MRLADVDLWRLTEEFKAACFEFWINVLCGHSVIRLPFVFIATLMVHWICLMRFSLPLWVRQRMLCLLWMSQSRTVSSCDPESRSVPSIDTERHVTMFLRETSKWLQISWCNLSRRWIKLQKSWTEISLLSVSILKTCRQSTSSTSWYLTCVLWTPGSHCCQTGRICLGWDSETQTDPWP